MKIMLKCKKIKKNLKVYQMEEKKERSLKTLIKLIKNN